MADPPPSATVADVLFDLAPDPAVLVDDRWRVVRANAAAAALFDATRSTDTRSTDTRSTDTRSTDTRSTDTGPADDGDDFWHAFPTPPTRPGTGCTAPPWPPPWPAGRPPRSTST